MFNKKDILDKENLKLAFARLKAAKRHIHKDLYRSTLRDIEPFQDIYLDFIAEKFLSCDELNKDAVVRLYLPKRKGFIRPITYMGFENILIYQAIINKISAHFRQKISPYYNKIIFGNIFHKEKDSIFMFSDWKESWNNYQQASKRLIDKQCLNYVLEFDIASFYDSINHQLLRKCLIQVLDEDVLNLLFNILELTCSDFPHIDTSIHTGIPQGHEGSSILAEIFLYSYIDIYFNKQTKNNDVAYLRYADDIRVFSSNELTLKKFITLLDLLCRNLCLIPQSQKVDILFYQTSQDFINQNQKKLSCIGKYYKKTKKLKSKDNNKAINKIKSMLKSQEIDKTVLRFYIYKIEKDNELRDLILSNIKDNYEFCKEFLFYLQKYYQDDKGIIRRLELLFFDEDNFFLDYPLYEFLLQFSNKLEFKLDIFLKLFDRKEPGKWLSKIALIKWASHCNQKELILSLESIESKNPLLKREIEIAKLNCIDSGMIRSKKILEILKDENIDSNCFVISHFWYRKIFFNSELKMVSDAEIPNPLLGKIVKQAIYNHISQTLIKRKPEIKFYDSNNFFNKKIFEYEDEFEKLCELFNSFIASYENKKFKPFIDEIDQFSNLVVDKLFLIEHDKPINCDYGSFLKGNNFIKDEILNANEIFLKIHLERNEIAHPKNEKTGKINFSKFSFNEKSNKIKGLFDDWLDAIHEILIWFAQKK